MRRQLLFALLPLLPIVTFNQAGVANDEKKEEAPPKNVTLTGVFEAVQSSELSAGTEELAALKIRKIVPHGTKVRKGQTVVWFETEDVDKKIEAAEVAHRLAELDLEDAEFGFEQFLEAQELDRAAAERSRHAARQTHDNYVQTDRDRSVLSAEFSLKSAQASYDNAAEELKQLEQMYKEDELTEESEEIVLKRAKQAVENAQYRLDSTEIQTERTLKQTIPRQAEQAEDTLARAELAFQKAVRTLELAKAKQTIDLQQKRKKFQDETANLEAMQAERRKLVVVAPHDGIAFHGALTRGKLSDKPSSLKADSSVTSKQVLITLVNPKQLQIRTELTEALLKQVTTGMTGTASANALNDLVLNVRVKQAANVPFANNKFDCVLAIRKGNIDNVIPGTTCEAKLPLQKAE